MFKHNKFVEGITMLLLAGYLILSFLPDIRITAVLVSFLIQLGALVFIETFKDREMLEEWQKGGFLIVNSIWVWWAFVFIVIILVSF